MARVYDRFLKQRLTRRRILHGAGVTAAGAAGIALVGCGGGGGDGEGGEDDGEVTLDGVLHIAHSQVLPTLDTFGAAALGPNLAFGFTVFDHLFYVPLDTQATEFMLMDTFENPDEEGAENIITILPSVFHDKPPVNGRPVIASDIKATYEAYAADALAPGVGWHRNIMESIEAPDDSTVIIRQNQPYAWFFHAGGAGSAGSSNIHPVEVLAEGYDRSSDLIGSGRHMLIENRAGEFFELQRHPNWRVEGEPFLAGITSTLISETALAQATFKTGDIDTVGLSNKLEADQFEDEFGDEITVTKNFSRSYHALMLNLDRVPAFQNVKVRRAINLAINRQELIQGVEFDPEGGAPSGPIPPAQGAYALSDEEMDEYFRHDPDEAAALLKEADFPFDKQLTIVFPGGTSGEQQTRAQLLKEQFEAVGMSIKIEDQDLLSVWLPQTLPNGDYDITSYTQLPYDDPHFPLSFYTTHSPLGDASDPRGRNNMAYFDEELTAAIDDAEMELDGATRTEKVQGVVRQIMEKQSPMINLYSAFSFGARWNWYKGTLPASRGSFAGFNGRRWIDTSLRGS